MKFRESESVELKACVTDGIKKSIIAFANCNGGTIYVGVADGGEVVGVEDADKSALQVSNMVRDSIKPDVSMFVNYETIYASHKTVVCIRVQRGTNKPYYLADKGLRPQGVFVRQGFSSVSATDSAIRQLIKETDGDSYEDMRSVTQDLTFDEAKDEFRKRSVDFTAAQKRTLKLVSADGFHTNLGLLMSDQCKHTIKVAVFAENDQSVFSDRKEFSGSVFKQLHDVYNFIDFHNKTHSTFEELLRVDTKDYPVTAVREGLLNCLVHRDYSFSASTIISIYADHLEFISLGGIVSGLDLGDIMAGISVCRNPHLANVFYRLELIEAYGTGIRKIMKAYGDAEVKPEIVTSSNTFKLILPNVNAAKNGLSENGNSDCTGSVNLVENSKHAGDEIRPENTNEYKILQLLCNQKSIKRKDVEALLDFSASSAGRVLAQMVDRGLLAKRGSGRSTRYQRVE